MSRVLVFGSTINEIHLGCKALINGLDLLIREKIGKDVNIQHLSHRYLSPIFYQNILSYKKENKNTIQKIFSVREENDLEMIVVKDYNQWMKAYKEMYKYDLFLKLSIQNADYIVINVEGTIHHQAVLGQQMLAIGKMAAELKKEVYWVNFSVQEENKEILFEALKDAKSIAAREENSFNYLKSLGLNVKQSFDTAVLAEYSQEKRKSRFNEDNSYCLFTGSNVKKYPLFEIAKVIEKKGYKPIYLPMGLNDYQDLLEIKKHNIDCFEFDELNFFEIISIIKNFNFVISGRHHLNVLSILAGKPFIPLESNTWKIEGVCKMLDYKAQFNQSLSKRIDDLLRSNDAISQKFCDNITLLKKQARFNF